MSEWGRFATTGSVVRWGLEYAVVVGAAPVAVNHGDAIASGKVTAGAVVKMALAVTVPYLVSTFSSVGAMLELSGADPEAACLI